jgi:hypothetical protein
LAVNSTTRQSGLGTIILLVPIILFVNPAVLDFIILRREHSTDKQIITSTFLLQAVLDLAKLKKGTLFTLKKRTSSKLAERYDYSVTIVGRR